MTIKVIRPENYTTSNHYDFKDQSGNTLISMRIFHRFPTTEWKAQFVVGKHLTVEDFETFQDAILTADELHRELAKDNYAYVERKYQETRARQKQEAKEYRENREKRMALTTPIGDVIAERLVNQWREAAEDLPYKDKPIVVEVFPRDPKDSTFKRVFVNFKYRSGEKPDVRIFSSPVRYHWDKYHRTSVKDTVSSISTARGVKAYDSTGDLMFEYGDTTRDED